MQNYKENVEKEFERTKESQSIKSNNKTSGCEDVLQLMYDNFSTKIWWWSWEFIGKSNSKGNFLSHRSPARASDLALFSPLLVEDRRVGRFKMYRLRLENMYLIKNYLKITYNPIETPDEHIKRINNEI